MSGLAEREFRRILIIKPSSPGDILHALPVLRGLRRRYPDAHIAWLVASAFVDLVEKDAELNEVIPFDRKRFGRVGRSLTVTAEFVLFLRGLRRRRFDLVIDLQGLFRSGFIARATGAAVRIGPAEARELAGLFHTHRLPRRDRDAHAVEKNYALAEVLGFDDAPARFEQSIIDADRQAAAQLLKQAGFLPGERFAVLVPATRWETKCWPAERFGLLARRLRDAQHIDSVLVGGPGDRALGEAAADASGGAAKNLCGTTTLRELAALIEKSAIVITADSTPMHMAAALDRPLVALFGPTSPNRTGPYERMGDVLRLDLDCAPCYFRKLRQCPHAHACMQQLDVEQVFAAASSRLLRTAATA